MFMTYFACTYKSLVIPSNTILIFPPGSHIQGGCIKTMHPLFFMQLINRKICQNGVFCFFEINIAKIESCCIRH
jgi:hypothetical protein